MTDGASNAVILSTMPPAQQQGWHVLLDLGQERVFTQWCLIGGQLTLLHAAEHGVRKPQPTLDMDVVVNLVERPGGTEWLAGWLVARGFEMDGVSPEGIGHRFTHAAGDDPRLGQVRFDILAPENMGQRANLFTRRPARTVQAPGTRQALDRAQEVSVTVPAGGALPVRTGTIRRPSLLGALVGKACAVRIATRTHPERDLQDAAVLLACIQDPIAIADTLVVKDRRRLTALQPLADADHPQWRTLDPADHQRGHDAVGFLLA